MTASVAILAAIALCHVVPQYDAFTLPPQQNQQRGLWRAPPLIAATTVTGEDLLTEQEEEILFGVEVGGATAVDSRKRDKFGNVLSHQKGPRNRLDHANDPLINKLHTLRETATSCPQLWLELGQTCPNLRAVLDEHMCDCKIEQTFGEFATTIQKSAAVFAELGIAKGKNVAVFAENSAVWLMVDQGLQLAGGASAVRGADAPLDELRYIYEHSDSAAIAVLQGPKLLQKLMGKGDDLGLQNDKYGKAKTILLMHREKKSDEEIQKLASKLGVKIHVFADLMKSAAPRKSFPALSLSDLATIVYTSGTTGRPK
jgi:non-ribosomal peptide synthetase component F